MKIITGLLSVIIAGTATAYASLYLDNQHLQDELKLLQENYDLLAKAKSQSDPSVYSVSNTRSPNTSLSQPDSHIPINQSPATNSLNLLDQNLKRMLEQKYTILFSILRLSGQDQEKIKDLLMARERIVGCSNVGYLTSDVDVKASVDSQQALVAQVDHQISALLKPDDLKKYELLKDSSYEQQQINNFYNSLANKQGLSEEKKNTLLLSKLEEKQAYARLLDTSADEINNAAPADKKILAERFKESMRIHRDSYLRVAKENLNDEQYAALRDNEQKQFEEVWQGVIAGWQSE